jgi:hypothetical protein
LPGVFTDAFAEVFTDAFADAFAVFALTFELADALDRAAVLGGGGVALLDRTVLALTFELAAAFRLAVVAFAVRVVPLEAALATVFRLADLVCPREDFFAVDLVTLGMVCGLLPEKGWRTVPHASRLFGNVLLAEQAPRILWLT